MTLIRGASIRCSILASCVASLACSSDAKMSVPEPAQSSAAGAGAVTAPTPVVEPRPVGSMPPPPSAAPAPASAGAPGLHEEDGVLVFRTEPLTIPKGSERYLCWTAKTTKALQVNAIEFGGSSGVHHLTFAQTIVPEPEGLSECEVLLKMTWLPLFSAGAGANKLDLPDGLAHQLTAGTQLLVQLHLLNVTDQDVTIPVALNLETTEAPNTLPVKIGGFGSFKISLPPHQKSSITHECTLPGTSRVVALMPHMHQLATSMTLEMGTSAADMKPIYKREPWDFDQQTIDNVDMMFEAGKRVRVTCSYDNTTDKVVTYGESSWNEMCFLGAFWVQNPMNCVQF